MTICPICRRICKNTRGLKIHNSHMHLKVFEPKVQTMELEILNLQSQLAEIRIMIMENKTEVSINTKLPKVPDNGSPTIGQNYGSDHGALMNELRSVLKNKIVN